MEVLEAIRARKSVREYRPDPVEPEKLERVLEAGRLAPSANNAQAWKFVTVTDLGLRRKVADACEQPFVGEAPVILVICANQPKEMLCGQPARTIDCSIALSFMMLQAADQGLGTCWLGHFRADRVREALNVPGEYEIVAVTPLGYPAKDGNPRSRKPAGDVVVREHF